MPFCKENSFYSVGDFCPTGLYFIPRAITADEHYRACWPSCSKVNFTLSFLNWKPITNFSIFAHGFATYSTWFAWVVMDQTPAVMDKHLEVVQCHQGLLFFS